MAGNGGKMAEEQQVSSRNKKGGKTGSTANGGKSERGNQNGAERLRRAADRRVGMHSEEIADRLTEKALKGDLASAKELMRLAEGKKPLAKPVKKRRGPGPAERLAGEPQWRAPLEEKEVTGGVEVEAEG